MNFDPLLVFSPLSLPLLAAVAGFLVGLVIVRAFRSTLSPQAPFSIAFAVVLVAAAIVSNSHQQLYDFGLSFLSIDILQIVVYGLVGISIFFLWRASQRLWVRGVIALLGFVSLIQPLLWTFAFATWSVGGFAP